MSTLNLLVRVYFEEHSQEGLAAVRALLERSENAHLTVYSRNRRTQMDARSFIEAAQRFNIVEGKIDPDLEIKFRYRPAPSSIVWSGISDIPSPHKVISSDEHEIFTLFLTLLKFERHKIDPSIKNSAVFEFLCKVEDPGKTIEETISRQLVNLCSDLLFGAWGYADIIPFRQLSLEEEWSIARTDLLWLDLSVTADAVHQYLFFTAGTQPPVKVPENGVSAGPLRVFRLPGPHTNDL